MDLGSFSKVMKPITKSGKTQHEMPRLQSLLPGHQCTNTAPSLCPGFHGRPLLGLKSAFLYLTSLAHYQITAYI